MITVSEAAEKIVKRSRYLSEALSKDIINVSSLARYIKPEIEGMLMKKVSTSSIIMALKRLSGNVYPETPYQEIFNDHPEITIKTNLAFVVLNKHFEEGEEKNPDSVLVTDTPSGSAILGSKKIVLSYVDDKANLYYPVSSISVPIPKEGISTPGIYYFFLKSLAWERINILNMFTSPSELVIVVAEEDSQRTLGVLRSLFENLS